MHIGILFSLKEKKKPDKDILFSTTTQKAKKPHWNNSSGAEPRGNYFTSCFPNWTIFVRFIIYRFKVINQPYKTCRNSESFPLKTYIIILMLFGKTSCFIPGYCWEIIENMAFSCQSAEFVEDISKISGFRVWKIPVAVTEQNFYSSNPTAGTTKPL